MTGQGDRCAECLHELKPAIEKAFARRVKKALVERLTDRVQRHESVSPGMVMADFRAVLGQEAPGYEG